MSTPEEPGHFIEFHGPLELNDPAPFRAAQVVPEWLRGMEAQRSGPGNIPVDTLKRCSPFVDAITAGYIIPLRRTVKFIRKPDGGLSYEAADNEVVSGQSPIEYKGAPFESAAIVKFKNSWIIQTPPGYSSLFVPLLNRVDFPFQILAGVVDTDVFYKEVFFPSICLMVPGTQVVLEQGTPLVQVIPFKREAWQSRTAEWDKERRIESEVDFRVDPHKYRQDLRAKKEFR